MLGAIFGISAIIAAVVSYLICEDENNLTLSNLVTTFIVMWVVIFVVIMFLMMAL
jgi:uncharacterized membrane protein